MATSKSPAIPLPGAELPFPLTLSCIPSTTPAGIFTVTVSSLEINPCPSEPSGRLSILCPAPPQVGHAEAVCIRPKIVLVTLVTWP